ncbi:hypothetical protein OGAPHI_006109 [Ogataea philodendri]|uniref:Uncharacterized protein n=1 Tax=Ogataea philodendri TaxID=1378263 RepID=A0A9P8NYP0_9ASCO|nr:uncharacterized protein OGAPHI_006109 [Ogataea philodendri]KAH3661930.1 hypothetical protein OGAPHI_006109 [Ogataea philodendri]
MNNTPKAKPTCKLSARLRIPPENLALFAVGRKSGSCSVGLFINNKIYLDKKLFFKENSWDYKIYRYPAIKSIYKQLLIQSGDHTSTDGLSRLSEVESLTSFQSNRTEQLNNHLNIVSWHDLLGVILLGLWELQGDTDVGGSHKHLWLVVLTERSVSSTFLFGQDVHGSQELLVWLQRTNLGSNHTSLDLLSLDTSQQDTWGVTGHGLVKVLVVHLDTDNSTSTGDGEHLINRQQEWLLEISNWGWDVLVNSSHQLLNGLFTNLWLFSFQSTQSRSHDNWSFISVETVRSQQFSHFHLNKLQHLWVIDGVNLVNENNQLLDTNLSGKQQVLSGLRHLSVGGGNNNNGTVHLSSTGNHVFDVILMAWTVNVRVVSVRGFILNVSSGDGDTSGTLFWSLVNRRVVQEVGTSLLGKNLGDGGGQGGLTVIHMANGTNVDMGLGSVESSRVSHKRVGHGLGSNPCTRHTADLQRWQRSSNQNRHFLQSKIWFAMLSNSLAADWTRSSSPSDERWLKVVSNRAETRFPLNAFNWMVCPLILLTSSLSSLIRLNLSATICSCLEV